MLIGGWNLLYRENEVVSESKIHFKLGARYKSLSKKKGLLSVKISGFRGIKINHIPKYLLIPIVLSYLEVLFLAYYFLRHIGNTDFPHIVCLQDKMLMSVLHICMLSA